MASLLPSTADKFQNQDFWKDFYARRQIPFEWYGEYEHLSESLDKYIRAKDRILQVGCGNSTFAEDLYDGLMVRDVTSIDVVDDVIAKQVARAERTGREGLVYEVMDAAKLRYPAESFNVVLDKGTLDALLPDEESASALTTVHAVWTQVDRVLSVFGRYVVVSLAQRHVLKAWVEFWKDRSCLVRVHVIYNLTNDSFVLPVFLLVVTKLKQSPGSCPKVFEIAEVNAGILGMEKLPSTAELSARVEELQLYCVMCKRLRKEKLSGEVGLILNVRRQNEKKLIEFDVRVLDVDVRDTRGHYAVFVAPAGREHEYHFDDPAGRQDLARQAGYSRLAIVRLLSLDHGYTSVDEIKTDLEHRVMDFAPRVCHVKDIRIPFLSAASELSAAVTVCSRESSLNGNVIVTDTWPEEHSGIRRLVFYRTQTLVQSEARVSRKKAKKGQHFVIKVDHKELLCAHHRIMVESVNKLKKTDNLSVCLIGLGGGLLASHLASAAVPRVSHVVGVELDPCVLDVARGYFHLQDAVEVVSGCGAKMVAQWAHEGRHFDAVLIDVASDRYIDGVAAPVPALLSEEFLVNLAQICDDILAVNIVTRSSQKRESISSLFSSTFSLIRISTVPDEVNCVITLMKPKS